MPVWLRKFTFNKLKEFHEEETPTIVKTSTVINRPDFVPTYTTRAPTK